MTTRELVWSERAEGVLVALAERNRPLAIRVDEVAFGLQEDPHPPGVRKLGISVWCVELPEGIRITYVIEPTRVLVARISNAKKDATPPPPGSA